MDLEFAIIKVQVQYIEAIGKMIKQVDLDIQQHVEENYFMKGNIRKIQNMDMELYIMIMGDMKDNFTMVKEKDMVFIIGMMEIYTQESTIMIVRKEQASII